MEITKEEATKIFKKYDKDRSGSMNRNEFKPALMELVGYKMTSDQLNQGFTLLDKDNNGQVDFNEFWAYCQQFNNFNNSYSGPAKKDYY